MTDFEALHRCPFGASTLAGSGARGRGVLLVAFGSAAAAEAPGPLGAPAPSSAGRAQDATGLAPLAPVADGEAASRPPSPLAGHLEHERAALAAALLRRDLEMPVRAAMLRGGPAMADELTALRHDGAEGILVIPVEPQASLAATASVCDSLVSALASLPDGQSEIAVVHDWHLEPRFVSALASAAYEALDALWSAGSSWRPNVDWALGSKMDAHVVFVARALPVTSADPYPALVEETASAVAGSLGLRSWSHAFYDCSPAGPAEERGGVAAAPPGPTLADRLRRLADRDERDVVVCPVGTIADDADLLHEVDVLGQRVAAEVDVRLERARSLNDDPVLIAALADIVSRGLRGR